MTTKPKFSVVVPVLNSKQHLRNCLDSILAAMKCYGNAELIVLDNGSDDGSYEILTAEYGERAHVQQIRGITVSALRNRGAELSAGEVIAFIDSDCVIGADYFQQAAAILRTKADVTGSEYALDDSCNWIQRTWRSFETCDDDGYVKYITSGNLVMKREAFFAVAGFDESMVSCEDVDLGWRLNKAGFKVYQAHAVRALHPGSDPNLRVFFRKSAWRSMGMFRMMKHTWMNKPILITFAHLLLVITAAGLLLWSRWPLAARVAAGFVLVNIAPGSTMLYLALRVKRLRSPLRAMLLYHVYFLARFYALWTMLASLGASSERKLAISARLHSSPR